MDAVSPHIARLSPELQSGILTLIEHAFVEHDRYILEPALEEIWKKLELQKKITSDTCG